MNLYEITNNFIEYISNNNKSITIDKCIGVMNKPIYWVKRNNKTIGRLFFINKHEQFVIEILHGDIQFEYHFGGDCININCPKDRAINPFQLQYITEFLLICNKYMIDVYSKIRKIDL